MTRVWVIVALLSGGALLCGCTSDVTATGEPVGVEWSLAYGGSPIQGGPAVYGEMPIRDARLRDDSVILGFGPGGSQVDPYYYYDEDDEQYYESVRVCYRRYFSLSGERGPRQTRFFWEAGVSAGPTFVASEDPYADPWEESYWERSEGTHALLGGGVRWWFAVRGGARSPGFMEFSVNAVTDVEASPSVAFAVGWSFGGKERGRTGSAPETDAGEPGRRSRWTRAEIYKARAEALARRKADLRKGAFGLRTGVLLPAPGETADYGQCMLLGLSYRFAEPRDARFSREFVVDFGLPEDVGSYESTPAFGGVNLLFPLGSETEDPRLCLIGGIGVATEHVRELATGDESDNSTLALNLGGGIAFAGGQLDMRLVYSLFGEEWNVAGRAGFTVTCSF